MSTFTTTASRVSKALIASTLVAFTATPSFAENADAERAAESGTWQLFFDRVWEQVEASPGGSAARAYAEAGNARVNAARGDMGLSLNGNAQYYPDGLGASEEAGVTNLEQRAEIRLQWQMLDFLARRGGRIDQAQAEQQLAEARARQSKLETATALIDDAVCEKTMPFRRQALESALDAIDNALDASRAAEDAPRAELVRAAEQGTARASRTGDSIRQQLAGLRGCGAGEIELPPGYLSLPLQAPARDTVERLAATDPEIAELQAGAAVRRGEARALRWEGVQFSVYGGYIAQRREQAGGREESTEPQVGASLTVPLRWHGNAERKAAEAQAQALSLDALTMLERKKRSLELLRQQWSGAGTRVEVAEQRIQRLYERLKQLEQRASSPVTGAEPWEVALHRAELWLAVSEAWEARAEWMSATLHWALRAPGAIGDAMPLREGAAEGLCTPLPGCPS